MIKLLKKIDYSKGSIYLILLLTFIQSIAELLLPTLMADIVDIGIVEGDVNYIVRLGLYMLIISLFGMLGAIWKSYLSARVGASVSKDIRNKVFTKIESFSSHEFNQIGGSSLITRTTNDVTQVQSVLIMVLNMFLWAPMMGIGGLIMAISRDVELTGILGIVLFVMVVIIAYVAYKAVPMFSKQQKRIDNMNLVLRERLTGIRVIRAFNRTKREKERYTKANVDIKDIATSINRLMAILNPLMLFIFNVSTVAIIYFGAFRIDAGSLQVGDLMAFIQYAMQIMFSLVMFTMLFIILPRGEVSAKRINEVLEVEKLNPDINKSNLQPTTDELVFDNVTFKYPLAEEAALSNISFNVKKGETLAVIGSTGSGKSTLINLIPKFFLPSEGSILVNGTKTTDYTEHDLREKIGFVPQKVQLFSGSLRKNIQFGKELSDEEITKALDIAQGTEFLEGLDDGLDHEITQGGTNVSGGQKQRISIARAIADNKFVYVFDDSFSALDYATDSRLRKRLKKELVDSVVIVVAQRVSTIKDADQILVLDQGQQVGLGTHDDLMENNKIYQQIVYSQLSEEELANE